MEIPILDVDEILTPSGLILRQASNPVYNGCTFGEVHDLHGNPVAFLRDSLADNFSIGLKALEELGKSGIRVTAHAPFVTTEGIELLLTEYVDGPTLDEIDVPEDTLVRLAVSLGGYHLDRLRSGEIVLGDIISPFQYKVKDGEPILIDLDMHYHTPSSPDSLARFVKSQLIEIAETYDDILSGEGSSVLADRLQMMHREVGATIDTDSSTEVMAKAAMGRIG